MNYDVGDALSRIETILLDSIGRNMKRHLKEESNLQKAWSMWQTEQLAGLGNWSAKNYKQFAPQFTKINNSAMNLLQQANQNGELNEEIRILQTGIQNAQRFFDVPNDKLDSLLKAVRSDLSRAEHSILRKADDVYREALFDSHFYLQSGTGTLNSAIDMAVSDMHQRGMNSIVYRNGAHVSASVYARMALRTANERAQLLGEGKARDKFGIHTVIVPPSGIACPKCSVWLCKVLVDDVYSAGTPQEAEELKLPLLSEAIRQGFLHPQCNCSPQTYFPESPVPEMSDSQREEAVRKYRITQKQRYHERQIRKWKQAEKSAPDEASKKSASARKREWQKRCKDLCDQNSDFLRRDYFREKIYDNQTPPIIPNVIDKPTPPEPTPKITETKPAVTAPEVQAIQNPVPMQNIISENSEFSPVGFRETFQNFFQNSKENLSGILDKLRSGGIIENKKILVNEKEVTIRISERIHKFPDGNGKSAFKRDAVVFQTDDGMSFIFPKDMDTSQQTMTPELAISSWFAVPEKLRSKAPAMFEFVDYENPRDTFWKRIYPNFKSSYACGGANRIVFWKYLQPHNPEYVTETYCHETGHFIDAQLAVNGVLLSDSAEWILAIEQDKIISGLPSPTKYGRNSNQEDFADSIKEYVKNPLNFSLLFPNRYIILEKIIGKL